MYENLQVLQYYGSMSMDDFLAGQFHRPWGTNSLQREFQAALAAGMVEVCQEAVRLTAFGKEVLQGLTRAFIESGFIKFRSRLIRFNKFNDLDDVESIMKIVLTNASDLRRQLIEFSGIRPGAVVLELGCGNGALTFGEGLYEIVGPNGRLIATDPSTSMLASVNRKRLQCQADWVEAVHAKAERLPFPDNTFDHVIGSAFLHLTNIEESGREIARVLKPGGTFSTFYPLHFPGKSQFFLEWFEPLLKLAPSASQPDVLPGPDTVPDAMRPYFEDLQILDVCGISQYSSPQVTVEMLVDISNVFEEHMATLPWRAREDLIQTLIRRGEEICRKYPKETLVEQHPGQMIRATLRA